MLIRRSFAIGLILVSVLLLALLFGETISADSHGEGRPPASSSGLPDTSNGKAPVVQPGVPPVVEWVAEVDVTPELLGRLMQDELHANRAYIASIRSQKGEEAALQTEEALKAPYVRRIAEIEAGAKATESIPMVTISGVWSFSKTSHRGAYLSPSDPVSILFYWDGKAEDVYSRMDSIHTCRPDQGTCNHFPQYQDHDARAIPFISCSSSAQWVYLGNGGKGDALSWYESEYGLMKEDDACYGEARDHMRIYGSVRHPTYKWWSVATPHHEQWGFTGHAVDSWESAQELFAGSWVESGLSNDKPGWDTSVFWWSFSQWGNDGTYGGQDVYFDGMGIVIATDLTDSDGDSVPDTSDNCPAWPNADQGLPPWPVTDDDPDCDGFSVSDEEFIGTDPNLACGPNAWPPDFNDDGLISVSDVLLMKASFGAKNPDDPIYDARRDLNPDGKISISDVLMMREFFDQECT